ncbi:ketoglutarate-dependent dioxygenase alkB homolog 6 [Seminavis robusta]|uniref:Ketoglutarate-dependent dioxygenase alkB homolog 6 n=1 Tax=Seminavis robusta TaxID=568900 RepID=A0A9N8HBQ7_9STRA|nr:ketoglutarate-dependent dioxygenase alkB homolog 6 [Seminavis robusta]|eukprot:Sro374_g129220.1 ketoglutarate-dependent dioxygenase alkB homolog 6 (350) ;mRNA; f:17844-18893
MDDGAIDFRKLLKEEKRKAKLERQRQQQQQQQKDDAVQDPSTNHAAVATDPSITNHAAVATETNSSDNTGTTNQTYSTTIIREEDVDALDFERLVQEEKEASKKRQHEQAMADGWSIPQQRQVDPRQHLVCSNPPSIFYIPNFMPQESDQQALMEWLLSLPDNNQNNTTTSNHEKEASLQANGTWTTMHYAKRRVALFDGTLQVGQSTLPPPLQRFVTVFCQQGIFPVEEPPNHVLINEYSPGQGILPHTDGPAYISRTATLSLGSDVLLQFTPRPHLDSNQPTTRQLWLEKGSLLVFQDAAYLDYMHGIQDRVLEETVTENCLNAPANTQIIKRGYRISLTFRHKLVQ